MKIAIALRRCDDPTSANSANGDDCFAEFEVDEATPAKESASDEDVQVTVVLRGKRGELENPALGMTELVLRALEARDTRRPKTRDVIDVPGVAVST